MDTYWIVFAVACVILAVEIAIFFRQNALAKRRASRKLRRSINEYCG